MNELDNVDEFASIDFNSHREENTNKPDWFVNDGQKGTWQNGYTLRERVFPDGQKEVSVCLERHFVGPAMWPSNRVKRGESEDRSGNDEVAARAAKKRVRLCCKAIGADRMVTLTYRENMTDRELALKHFDLFRRRLTKAGRQFHYVAVIEQQERGALHFHIAVAGRQMYTLLRSIWQSILGVDGEGRQMGQVNVRDPHRFGFGVQGAHKIASYIAKYCGNEMQCRGLNEKRYFRSREALIN